MQHLVAVGGLKMYKNLRMGPQALSTLGTYVNYTEFLNNYYAKQKQPGAVKKGAAKQSRILCGTQDGW